MGGTFWIVRDGGIQVERLSLNNAVAVHTIVAGDVETIDVEDGPEGAPTSSQSGFTLGPKFEARNSPARITPKPCGPRLSGGCD
jgi:hypothetical protein